MAESTAIEGNGSYLNLDLYLGAADVLNKLRCVDPRAILHVSLEYNLMAEIVYDQEWIDILDCIGSLARLKTVSLSFRVPVPLPIRAFATFLEKANKSLESLDLSGLQLSTASESDSASMEALKRGFQAARLLTKVQLCRHRTIRCDATAKMVQEVDPLLHALLTNVPNLRSFRVDRTDIFTDQSTLELVCSSPVQALTIGTCERSIQLGRYLLNMSESLEDNGRLKELQVHNILRDDALIAIAELLKQNTSLDSVRLRIESDDFGNLLSGALKANKSLQSLHLALLSRDRARFRKNIAVIASALAENKQSALVDLRIDGAKGMRSTTMILDPFLKMLQHHNFTLQKLSINHNAVTLGADILFYLKLNRIGRCHLLRIEEEAGTSMGPANLETSFRSDWANALIHNKNDIRVLFYFLSRNPTILPAP